MNEDPLLDLDGSDAHLEKSTRGHARSGKTIRCPQWLFYVLLMGYIPLIFLCLFFYFRKLKCSHKPPDVFPSLARSNVLQYERRRFEVKVDQNPFAGFPRPELDAAWHELFEDTRMRVSEDDLRFYDVSSIPLADGSGYAAEFGVFHELHCLKKIRHWIFKDYYLANETKPYLDHYERHVNHCLELIRESITCRADPSLSTYEWEEGVNTLGFTAVAKGYHQCVKWDSLMEWVRKRAVPVYQPGTLVKHDV